MACIEISDSSDDEILFFPVHRPEPNFKSDYDDEVIFCGVGNAADFKSAASGKRKNRNLSLGKDVTAVAKTVRRNVKPSAQEDSDLEIEFLGIRKHDKPKVTTPCSISRVPAVRARSDSVNININSQKSLNTNLTINIEDNAESNKKKVQLTFLGPSNRNKLISPGVSKNVNQSFNPSNTSTPKVAQPKFDLNNKGTSTVTPVGKQNSLKSLPKNGKAGTARAGFYSKIHYPLSVAKRDTKKDMNCPGKGNLKAVQTVSKVPINSSNRNFNNDLMRTINNDFNFNRNINTNFNRIINNNFNRNGNSPSISNINFVRGNKNNKQTVAFSPKPLVLQTQHNTEQNKSSQVSKCDTSGIYENKKLNNFDHSMKPIKSKENLIKHKVVAEEKKSKVSIKSKEKSVRKSAASVSCDSSDSSEERKPNNSTKEGSRAGISNSKKSSLNWPVPGCSKARSDISYSSSEDESVKNEEKSNSSSESSDCNQPCQPSMSKPALDSLFYKFLENCTKVSSKSDVIKTKVRLKKLYLNSESVTTNEDFILSLKEGAPKIEKKSIKCPLDIMKKVYAQLRKDSPSNEKNIKKLESVLKKINSKIKELEEVEVTSDEDENDNCYVKLDRYRKRAVQIYNKLCELSSVPADAERPTLRNISFQGMVSEEFSKSQPVQTLVIRVSRALEKYYNKTHKFPDFQDVRLLMTKLCLDGGFKLKPVTLHQLARNLFQEFGDMLQKRRLYDDYQICNEYLFNDEEDPYHYDPILAAKLDSNKKQQTKEHEVLQRYTLKQVALKEATTSHSSSENNSDEEKDNKKSKTKQCSSSEERSFSDDMNSCDASDFDAKVGERKGKDNSSSSDSEYLRSDDEKVKDKRKKKTKKPQPGTENENRDQKTKNKHLDDSASKKKRKRSRSFESDDSINQPIKEKHFKPNKNKKNKTECSLKISNNDEVKEDIPLHSCENVFTVITAEEDKRIKSIEKSYDSNTKGDNNVNVECNNSATNISDSYNLCEDAGDTTNVEIIDNFQIENLKNIFENVTESEGVTGDDDVVIESMSFRNNSSGLLITNVVTCQESFNAEKSKKEEINKENSNNSATIVLLSDDEDWEELQGRTTSKNVLSQEEVLELIPLFYQIHRN